MDDAILRTYIDQHNVLHAEHNGLHRTLQDNLAALTLLVSQHSVEASALATTISHHEQATRERVQATHSQYQGLRADLATHMSEDRHDLRDRAMVASAGGGLVALVGALGKLAGAW